LATTTQVIFTGWSTLAAFLEGPATAEARHPTALARR
jgi:hypothetical protein